jgi:glycine oxidase
MMQGNQQTIGIAGAGLLGRLLAWSLAQQGFAVQVFDRNHAAPTFDGQQSAGFTAAGMLSPLAELDNSSVHVAMLGWRSMGLWQHITAQLGQPNLMQRAGSLLLAHRTEVGAAQRVLARLERAPAHTPQPQVLTAQALAQLEPVLYSSAYAWLLPDEGHMDAVATMMALQHQSPQAQWHWNTPVSAVELGFITTEDGRVHRFDHVFDVRGAGGRPALPVRGVRGELLWLHLPEHGLKRPVRLLHSRHRVYIVPRSTDTLLVGASEIESEDRSGVSVRSAVELLTAAHSIFPALAEARIIRMDVNLRPALPDNEPLIHTQSGLTRINGLFRHGWLLAPALVQDALLACNMPLYFESA